LNPAFTCQERRRSPRRFAVLPAQIKTADRAKVGNDEVIRDACRGGQGLVCKAHITCTGRQLQFQVGNGGTRQIELESDAARPRYHRYGELEDKLVITGLIRLEGVRF